MLLSKKISKLRPRPSRNRNKLIKKNIRSKDPTKDGRCFYQEIPRSTKITYPSPIYLISGDLPAMEQNGELIMDISFYNQVKIYQSILVKELYNQRVIEIKPSPRRDVEVPAWTDFVEELNQKEGSFNKDLAHFIQVFCQKYIKVMNRQSRKKSKSGPRKKFFADVTAGTEKKKKELFENFPSFCLKFRLRNHENILQEMLFSESFVSQLGYSAESFVTSVFQEGIPRLMANDDPSNAFIIKTFIQNYFAIEDDGFELPEYEATLLVKNDFMRRCQFKTHFLMNYETNTFGIDIVFCVSGVSEPYSDVRSVSSLKLDADFVRNMVKQESQTRHFLSTFYDFYIQPRYTNLSKTCKIKDLVMKKEYTDFSDDEEDNEETNDNDDDDIIVKKNEEDI